MWMAALSSPYTRNNSALAPLFVMSAVSSLSCTQQHWVSPPSPQYTNKQAEQFSRRMRRKSSGGRYVMTFLETPTNLSMSKSQGQPSVQFSFTQVCCSSHVTEQWQQVECAPM